VGVRVAVALVAVAGACAQPQRDASSAPPSVRNDRIVSAGGLAPPAAAPHNPFAGDSASAIEGARIFSAMNCDGCHGGGAVGAVGPSLVDGRWRYGGTDGEVFASVFYGRPRGMPAYGGVLPPAAIWKVLTYLESQPRPQNLPTEAWSAAPR
jgi:mono/diheme cytochrome c family protein